MNKVRFNDKELSFVAHYSTPDKEGLLDKKGAVYGQGFRQRWFRLKGNLLFYFKIDELQDWQSTDPLGVIVLEQCKVEDLHSSSNPFGFGLVFEGDDTRNYILKAYSKQEQEGWMKAIAVASYERLRINLYQLQGQLQNITGQDPLTKRNFFSGFSPEKHSSSGPQVAFERAPVRARVNIINAPQSQLKNAPSYVLELESTNLKNPSLSSSSPFSTRVHIFYASELASVQRLVSLDSTEVVECPNSSCSYWHMILLQLGVHLSSSGNLVFKVVSTKTGSKPITTPTSTRDSSCMDNVSFEEEEVGTTSCTVSQLITHSNSGEKKAMRLSISKNNRARGFLNVRIKQIRHNPLPPVPSQFLPAHRAADSPRIQRKAPPLVKSVGIRPPDLLPDITRENTWKHFVFPQKNSTRLNVVEELAESVFNTLVPLELLKCFRIEDNEHLEEMVYNIGAVSEHIQKSLKYYEGYLFHSVGFYSTEIKQLEETEVDLRGFKPSQERQDSTLQFLPTNLHIQRLHVSSQSPESQSHTYNAITMGSPADHISGHKDGKGLMSLLNELPSNPSFISHYTNYTNSSCLIKAELDKLSTIRINLDAHKNTLYRSSGNASPQEMTSAFTMISAEIQKLLGMMQSSVVLEAIQDLIRARPGNPVPNITSSASISTASELIIPEDRRRLTLRRKLPAPYRMVCNCGVCSKCIPSPSDWLWNGSHYIQVSTGEWKLEDSTACIQELLVRLLDKVEEAAKKVVEQQHEAHAASTDNKLATFKPSYVWSSSLVPAFLELNQTAEGLIKLARSSLIFEIMRHDSCITGLFELKKRLDVVFCQAITVLVTSFYLTLGEHFKDANYLKQIKEIGFLAQFECLLSSAVEDKGILEDMVVGVAELKNVSFQLAAISGNTEMDFRITGNRRNLIVHLLFNRKILSDLPDDQLKLGHPIKVIPCLVAYGVNESSVESARQLGTLQEETNKKCLASLSNYIENYKKMTKDSSDSVVIAETLEVRENFKQLKVKYEAQKSKSVEFLISVHQLCRKLKGGRITSCRTGKDRSSMSVTLEECCLLKTQHGLDDSAFVKALSALRSTGTQLDNCFKNTGYKCYRFSSTQYEMLPRILQPPVNTCRYSTID